MKQVTMTDNTPIYTDPLHIMEAFSDIASCFNHNIFEDIVYDDEQGTLSYTVYGKRITRVFDMTQATPEIAQDILQWVFSMLDAMANI